MSTPLQRPAREVQALAEVGVTRISRSVAWGLMMAFVLTISVVLLVEPFLARPGHGSDGEPPPSPSSRRVWSELVSEIRAALAEVGSASPLVVNRSALAAMDRFETTLEEESFLRRSLLPRLQWRLTAGLGLGNEQVYVGREDWLFFRRDVDYVTGPGFLEPSVLEARRRGGEAWLPAPNPDPVSALVDLDRQLRQRRIHLIVMPTPVKSSIEPGRFSQRAAKVTRALENRSFARFLKELAAAGVDVFDPAPLLVESRLATGKSQYLRTDTHWLPTAVDTTARALAERVQNLVGGSAENLGGLVRRPVAVEGLGDIAAMLWLPADQQWLAPESVRGQMVLRADGGIWQPRQDATVLLLGDSFTNVYSDPALGWGRGAGLAEQLGYHLQLPVDRLAVNAGGALQVRQILQRALARDEDRLADKRVVIYQFAARELAQGDWQVLELADTTGPNR